MKHIVFKDTNKKDLQDAIKKANKFKYKSKLIQIFTATTDKKEIATIIKKYSKKFPDATIIGTTTAGEILEDKIFDNHTIISLSLFEKTTLKTHYVKTTDKESAKILSKKICSKHTKASIILSEGLHGENYEAFIKQFKEENPDIIIAGGLAGDNFKLEKTYVFLDDKIYDKGSIAVSLSSKSLFANNKYNLNWEPIGKEFTITSSTSNVIHEIDNQSAVSFFKKYLGEEIFFDDAKALPDFQLLYKEGSTTVSRTPLAVDGESLIFAAAIKEGQVVQFGFSNAASIVSGSIAINKEIKKKPAEAIYIFSCIARKTLLGHKLEDEFVNFSSIAPTAGFFTYGEYYSTTQNNTVLNCTTTLLILSESKKKVKEKNKVKHQKNNIDDITFSALTHYVKQTSEELNFNAKILNQYKDAVDYSMLVSKTDVGGNITYVNDNFCRVSQYSQEELIGNKHSIVRDPSVSEFIFKKMWNKITDGQIWKGKFSNKAKDGSIYFVDATIMPIFNEKQEIEEFIAIRQDITKETIAKNKMKEKEKFIKAIFDNQDSIVIYASPTEGMININKTFFKYFDYRSFSEFKFQHKCICELFIKEEGYIDPQTHENWLNDIALDEDTDYKVKMKIRNNDIHTFNLKVKKIDDKYIINLYDITKLETALLKAYSSEQAKTTFLANMSHEIRTPLNGILGFTDVLSKRKLDKDSAKYVNIINKSGQTLLNVVNDILDFSKLESGELSIYETESNLFADMEATVSTFASLSKTKKINYYTYIDTGIPKLLKCDSQRIKQIVNNLISNAIKFTPEGGRVSVSIKVKKTKNKESIIIFSVKDSGIGIAKDKLSTVFQAFSQADDSISRKFGGTGLGLSISSQYASMMGGTLKVKSKEGVGSEFYFTLKLAVVDSSNHLDDKFDVKDKNILILQPKDTIACGINEITKTYLDKWKFKYKNIDSMKEIDENTDIIIVCADNFEPDVCKESLNKYENLQLIYIEGGDEQFKCSHKQFHLIEQPMTGSALFDKIITLTHNNDNVHEGQDADATKQFSGNILVAEDNQTNQMLISVMLETRGLQYTIVENGQEAVSEAMLNDYDLIFMDINMPVMDGITATKLLRKDGYQKPIISLSANVIESDIKIFIEAGVDNTLNKPIVVDELDSILHKYLNNEINEDVIVDIKYDIIESEKIAKALSLPNGDIIIKLLNSFKDSAIQSIKNIDESLLDMEILHSIKGMAGNMRFNELYTLIKNYEDSFNEWDESQNRQNSEIVKSHLKNAIETIKSMNKN